MRSTKGNYTNLRKVALYEGGSQHELDAMPKRAKGPKRKGRPHAAALALLLIIPSLPIGLLTGGPPHAYRHGDGGYGTSPNHTSTDTLCRNKSQHTYNNKSHMQ